MNRIVLIGNGFDLAHGLKTSYADFIDWYWTKRVYGFRGLISNTSDDGLCAFKMKNEYGVWNVWAYNRISTFSKIDGKAIVEEIRKDTRNFSVGFTPMFHEICQNIETKGWVDIEEIYYKHLTQQDGRNRSVKDVNKELDIIKSNLIEYLTEIQDDINDDIISIDIQRKILEPISKEDIAIGSKNQWEEIMKSRMNFDYRKWEHLIEGYKINKENHHYSVRSVEDLKKTYSTDIIYGSVDKECCPTFRLPDNIMLLNFNYTNTADMYLPKVDKFSVIYIHGTISKPETVIFGYGDERDDEYEPLMKKNDNEYLRHIKSFRYLESSNYRKMLGFVDSGPYQLCIMGHSCGISDRTLLCTLFEHPNCISIKPYYYRKEDGSDNYFDLVCSIARNISDPRLMRDRVVRKERCEPLGKVREG